MAPYMQNQLYYQPKSVAHEPLNEKDGIRFVAPHQDTLNSQFNVNFLNMYDLGEGADCTSIYTWVSGVTPSTPLTPFNHFIDQHHSFSLVTESSTVIDAEILSTLSCFSENSAKKTTSKEELETTSIIAYPNPASKNLYLDNLPEVGDLKINLYNLQGKQILNKSFRDPYGRIQLDVSNLQNETYFIEVEHLGKIIFMKQIIKK